MIAIGMIQGTQLFSVEIHLSQHGVALGRELSHLGPRFAAGVPEAAVVPATGHPAVLGGCEEIPWPAVTRPRLVGQQDLRSLPPRQDRGGAGLQPQSRNRTKIRQYREMPLLLSKVQILLINSLALAFGGGLGRRGVLDALGACCCVLSVYLLAWGLRRLFLLYAYLLSLVGGVSTAVSPS